MCDVILKQIAKKLAITAGVLSGPAADSHGIGFAVWGVTGAFAAGKILDKIVEARERKMRERLHTINLLKPKIKTEGLKERFSNRSWIQKLRKREFS